VAQIVLISIALLTVLVALAIIRAVGKGQRGDLFADLTAPYRRSRPRPRGRGGNSDEQ